MKYEDNWLKRQKAHGLSCQYTVVEKYKTELSVAIYNMYWKMQIYCSTTGHICQENEICDEFLYDFFTCKMADRLCSCIYRILCAIKLDLHCSTCIFSGITLYHLYNFTVIIQQCTCIITYIVTRY